MAPIIYLTAIASTIFRVAGYLFLQVVSGKSTMPRQMNLIILDTFGASAKNASDAVLCIFVGSLLEY